MEEKKRETSPKPLNVNAQNTWRCRDPSIRASKPRWDEIRKTKGMVRRVKERQHWAGICAGMAMPLIYIEPIADMTPRVHPGGKLSCRPLVGLGGGGSSQDQGNQDQQRRAERDRPLSEEHKNKRRKLKQLELGQIRWGGPDKDG